jgi:hypothetical protein
MVDIPYAFPPWYRNTMVEISWSKYHGRSTISYICIYIYVYMFEIPIYWKSLAEPDEMTDHGYQSLN